MENGKTYLGLDIGSNSVGWAVTDGEYKLKRFKSNLMWGVHLFDEAQQSADRRAFRTARRRLDRRQQRIKLLQDLFASEILKKDEKFFLRLKESALLPEDSENRKRNIFFDDEKYGDKEYFEQYPTIHHLIIELMNNAKPHDVRLVYYACAYLLAHRGHFLFNVDKDNINNITDFEPIYFEFYRTLTDVDENPAFDSNTDIMRGILKKHISVTEREKELKQALFGGKVPKAKGSDDKEDSSITIAYDKLIKLISGGTVKLSELFLKEDYKELEKNSVCVKNADFDDTLEMLTGQIEETHLSLLASVKGLYDWSLLVDILNGHTMISVSKVAIYNKHKKDLEELKYFVRTYFSKAEYDAIFRDVSDKANYVSYVYNAPSDGNRDKYKKCSQEDFCKFLKTYIDKIVPRDEDKESYDALKGKINDGELCPKQVTTDNRVIPYQLYYAELKKILEKACGYLEFLNEKDEYGTVVDKILSIMEFRIPYYAGPLVSSDRSKNAWLHRKADGKIYPWNFKDMVDEEASENEFIRRMTCKCTYIAGADVLPKYSLLYSKFMVLNEINNIKVNGTPISVEEKQKLYQTKFIDSKAKVTKKRIVDYLITACKYNKDIEVSGIDDNVKSSLKSYHDFKHLMESGQLNETDVERIIERITVTTDSKRLKGWLKKEFSDLSDEDIKYISKLKYKDYGRLSKCFLEEVLPIDTKTGEIASDKNIITALWETNENIMQLLGQKYRYSEAVEKINNDYYNQHADENTISKRMENMYLSPAVRRSVIRTLDIVKELKTILKKTPDKIFIEMARGEGDTPKGKRTESRRDQITRFLDNSEVDNIDDLRSDLGKADDGKLRSEKYFLYFMQLGKCAYTGKTISFDELEDNHKWNIDHIWPQAKIKDDSLDNKVLVDTNANGAKSDTYPIDKNIRDRMKGLWHSLREKNLMSEKKYSRLIRSTPFTEDELSGFISRQLVETRQSTKAVAELLKELCPESEIVYVKAGIVSEFRQEMDMLKCREINDLHHAKDAYLNIVMGNVYTTKFTNDPRNFIHKHFDNYSIKLTTLLSQTIGRGNTLAWNPDTSFAIVRTMMAKNSIRYVRYTYKRKGGLFDQMPVRKKEGLIPRKKELDTEKYGGYNKATVSFFTLIKLKNDIIFVPVDLMMVTDYLNNTTKNRSIIIDSMKSFVSANKMKNICDEDIKAVPFGKDYCNNNFRIIKINSCIEIEGLRFNIKGKNDNYMSVSLATPLILSKELEMYVKKIESFSNMYKEKRIKQVSVYSGINKEMNELLYNSIADKCISKPFCLWDKFKEAGETLIKGSDKFRNMDVTDQTLALIKCLNILKTGRSSNACLSFAGGQENFHTERFGLLLNKKKFKEVYLIDQSPTGLFEKKSVNLLEL